MGTIHVDYIACFFLNSDLDKWQREMLPKMLFKGEFS